MKKEFRIMYVILPVVLAAIVHFVFWYGNKFRPIQEWSGSVAGVAALVMLAAIILGIALAMEFYSPKDKL